MKRWEAFYVFVALFSSSLTLLGVIGLIDLIIVLLLLVIGYFLYKE